MSPHTLSSLSVALLPQDGERTVVAGGRPGVRVERWVSMASFLFVVLGATLAVLA